MKYSNMIVSILEMLDTTDEVVCIPHGTFNAEDEAVSAIIRQLCADELIAQNFTERHTILLYVDFLFEGAPHLTPKGARCLLEMKALKSVSAAN